MDRVAAVGHVTPAAGLVRAEVVGRCDPAVHHGHAYTGVDEPERQRILAADAGVDHVGIPAAEDGFEHRPDSVCVTGRVGIPDVGLVGHLWRLQCEQGQ